MKIISCGHKLMQSPDSGLKPFLLGELARLVLGLLADTRTRSGLDSLSTSVESTSLFAEV